MQCNQYFFSNFKSKKIEKMKLKYLLFLSENSFKSTKMQKITAKLPKTISQKADNGSQYVLRAFLLHWKIQKL